MKHMKLTATMKGLRQPAAALAVPMATAAKVRWPAFKPQFSHLIQPEPIPYMPADDHCGIERLL